MTGPRCVAAVVAAVWTAVLVVSAQTVPPGSTFRVFLKGGDPLPSYGEAAIVGDRVIFTLLVGGETDLRRRYQLVDLPTGEVDLDRTVAYANAVRGAHYAATRGEAEYSEMTADVSRALDALPAMTDATERLRAAEQAKERMEDWSRRSYGYRVDDLDALERLFDVVLAELRADAGVGQLSVELSSRGLPRSVEPLQSAPNTPESVRLALSAATAADTGADRLAILRAAEAVLADEADGAELAGQVRARIAAEEAAEGFYAALATDLVSKAEAALGRGEPDTVASLLARLGARDDELGRMRPRLVRDLGRQLNLKLTATKAYRAALDHYAAARPALLGYERSVRPALATMDGLRPVIEAVREMRFTSFDRLLAAANRITGLQELLDGITPPDDLSDVHATLVSAVHLAREAVARRQVTATTMTSASSREAASAAAGSLLLFAQARSDLVARLFPPKPQ